MLALVSLGIFIESLYLTVANLKDYQDFNEISAEILNQKMIFEQYYEYAGYFLSDSGVANTLNEIKPLKSFFDELITKESKAVVEHDRENHFTIMGGETLILTREDYLKLKNIITQIRLEITKN
jgi:hypothetical protein